MSTAYIDFILEADYAEIQVSCTFFLEILTYGATWPYFYNFFEQIFSFTFPKYTSFRVPEQIIKTLMILFRIKIDF